MTKPTAESVFLYFGIAVFILLLVCRVPGWLIHPSLFMEEGMFYYKYAFEHDWLSALLMPHLGYYSFFANFVTVIAANIFPMEYTPLVLACGGLIVWALLAVVILLPGSPFKTTLDKILALWLTVLIPPSMGRFNLNHCQFYEVAAVVLVLVSTATSAREIWFHRAVIFFSGISGPTTVFLLPLYGIAFFMEKSKERLVQTLILALCGLVQVSAFLYSIFYQDIFNYLYSGRGRFSGLGDGDIYIFWLLNRAIIHPFLGWNIMENTGQYFETLIKNGGLLYYVVLIAGIVGIGLLAILMNGIEQSRINKASLFLLLSFFTLSILGFLTGLSDITGSKLFYLTTQHRYFIVPSMCMAWAFVINNSLSQKIIPRIIYRGMITALLVSGLYMWEVQASEIRPDAPDWKKEISLWRKDPTHDIAIMPPGFIINLRPKKI